MCVWSIADSGILAGQHGCEERVNESEQIARESEDEEITRWCRVHSVGGSPWMCDHTAGTLCGTTILKFTIISPLGGKHVLIDTYLLFDRH